MDRGITSKKNRVILRRAAGHYILEEKLRSNEKPNQAALCQPGRYRMVKDNLKIKEVYVGEGIHQCKPIPIVKTKTGLFKVHRVRSLFCLCHNILHGE